MRINFSFFHILCIAHLWQKFRENNVSTKDLIWRKKFSVTVNFSFFHTALCGVPLCGNCRNSFSHFFRKNFVKAMVLRVLLKKLLNSWFHEIFFSKRELLVFPHCGVKITEFYCHVFIAKIPAKINFFTKELDRNLL